LKNFQTGRPCVACGIEGDGVVCLHHVKSRGSGGSNHPSNLMPLCQIHHNQIHANGTWKMSKIFRGVRDWLDMNGWILDDTYSKWWSPNN
jgi:hypothetical protein